MIFTILLGLYIFFISSIAGHMFFTLIKKVLKLHEDILPNYIELSFLGLFFLGSVLSALSIFLKIGIFTHLLVLSILLCYGWILRSTISKDFIIQVKKFNRLSLEIKVLFCIYLVLVVLYAQIYPVISDTGLYHAQNIQWITEYKVIKGLGNLHGRFAFNNQSFLLESFFSLSFLKLGRFHLLNSYLLINFSSYLIFSLNRRSDGWIKSLLGFGLLILILIYYLKFVSSPSPDVFSAISIWYVSLLFLKKGSINTLRIEFNWIVIVFSTFFLITVKLSTIPLLLIILVFIFQNSKDILKRAIISIGLASVVLTPFFLRNYYISGYLIYPASALDIFNPDWKIPPYYVQEMKTIITTHAQTHNSIVHPFSEWIPIWFSNLSLGFRCLTIFTFISPLFLTLLILYKKSLLRSFLKEIILLIITYCSYIFWFFSAPNYRFIYGFLFIYILCFFIIIVHFFRYEIPLGSRLKILINNIEIKLIYKTELIILTFLALFFASKLFFSSISNCLIIPEKYKAISTHSVKFNNFSVQIPDDNKYCWDECLPCSIIQNNIGITNIEMRGKELTDGFRVKEQK